jgi:hypothetical protein
MTNGSRNEIGSDVSIQRVVRFAGRRFVVDLERDAALVRKGSGVAATTSVAQRPSKIVDDVVRAGPAELQGLATAGAAGGIEMTTRGVPSARATIALPIATA